jgi:hydroxypyruvate isomerase
MADLKQSVAWWCFADALSPEVLVRTAADIGYAALDLVPAEHWELVRAHGLSIAAIGGHQSLTDGMNRTANRQRILAELEASLKDAAAWGCPNVICFSGNRAGLDDDTGAKVTAETLRAAAKLAEDLGVTLVLELLNSKVDHPDYQADHTAWGVKVCEMVDSPRVRLLYDVYHMQVMEGDIVRTIKEQHTHIGHYHTAGNPGRHEMDDTQELNYRAIFRAIADTGYTGFIGHEFVPTGDPAQALRDTFALVQEA